VAKSKLQASSFFTSSTATAKLDDELTNAHDRIAELEVQLQQLTGESTSVSSVQKTILPINEIRRDPEQVRRWFDPDKISSLAQAIKVGGFRGTIWVRYLPDGTPQLVAGERRIRAAIEAGLSTIPVDILDVDEDAAFTLSLFENLQREDLNALEETEGILGLLARRLHYPPEEVISLLYRMKNFHEGKSPELDENFSVIESVFNTLGRISWLSFVTSRLPLLNMPEDILEVLRQGKLEYTKAKVVAGVTDEALRQRLLQESVEQNLSIRDIRDRAKLLKQSVSEQAESKVPTLRSRFDATYQRAKKSKQLWNNPQKSEKIEWLLNQLDALMDEESR
jgi:ParB family transcriptional regulator, chromosome partitioning protein